jgi:hypothetical protein
VTPDDEEGPEAPPQTRPAESGLPSQRAEMQYNFTDRVRKVLAMARDEAVRLQHDYVGTEHILLGLIREGRGWPPPFSPT